MHPTGAGGTHPKLFQWVRDYFRGRVQRSNHTLKQTPSNPHPSIGLVPGHVSSDSDSAAAAVSSPDLSPPPGTETAATETPPPDLCLPPGIGTAAAETPPPDLCLPPGTETAATETPPPDLSLPPGIGTTAAGDKHLAPEDIDYPPLYFQHEGKQASLCHYSLHGMCVTVFVLLLWCAGHSRTIVGLEERGCEASLLVLDPLHSRGKVGGVIRNPGVHLGLLLRGAGQVKMKEYEVVFVDGVLSDEEKEVKFQRHSYQCNAHTSNSCTGKPI